MSHLESLLDEYLDWQGHIVRRNIKVGRLSHGGWEMELDIVGYHPTSNTIVHYEPSIDALSWEKREARYLKKFQAGKKYIYTEVFSWLPPITPLKQIAVFISRPRERNKIAGGTLISIDELMSEIRAKVIERGPMCRNAISERYPLLRTLQMTHSGYFKAI
ncbi:MAG TPA: hypothetical protein VEX60_11945 [Pyrinomonadaceae bacterium]|nr:hypothetical protein [Pyrinomonadaceae bacterium]